MGHDQHHVPLMKHYRSALPVPLAEAHPAMRGFEMRRVSTRAEWNEARAIRYETLAARGDIARDEQRAYGDLHDEASNATTFLLSRDGEALAATRSSASSAKQGSVPAMQAFPREIEAVAGTGATIVEASLMAVAPSAPVDPKTALIHLFKAHMLHCAAEAADWLLVAVRDSQIGFYRRMFNMEILSGEERLPGLSAPRVLMGLDYREYAPLIFKRIPLLAVNDDDERDFLDSGVITFRDRRGALAVPRNVPALVAGD